jgi:hypothetical protein
MVLEVCIRPADNGSGYVSTIRYGNLNSSPSAWEFHIPVLEEARVRIEHPGGSKNATDLRVRVSS